MPPTPEPAPTEASQTRSVAKVPHPRAGERALGGAFFVAAGIFLSRVMGLIRQRVFAHYFGNSMAAAAFVTALRIPNYLQNLFGEGVLSASFIPVYAGLEGKGDHESARRVAGAVFGLLSVATSILVALGIALAPWLVDLLAPGLEGEGRALTIHLVRILFPGTGALVFSAWCLGILNSHRKFFLSYAAPVVWNVAIISALLIFGGRGDEAELARYAAFGVVAGSVLQFAVQLPSVLRLLGGLRPSLSTAFAPVRQVLRGFGPVVLGRGVVQISAYVDLAFASLISERAIAALSYAQTIYLVPVGLFGMAVSAAELPELSRMGVDGEEAAAKLRARIEGGLERIAFFVVPSAAAFLFLGDLVAGALLQTGRFTGADTRYAWLLLMGSAVGLTAATSGRLYSSAFYALKDTRTPLYFATVRVALGAALAFYAVRVLPGQLGVPAEIGAVGITAASGAAAWLEYSLLRRALAKRVGDAGMAIRKVALLWGAALASAVFALLLKWALGLTFGTDESVATQWGGAFLPVPRLHPVVSALAVLGTYGAAYLVLTFVLRVAQARALIGRLSRRRA